MDHPDRSVQDAAAAFVQGVRIGRCVAAAQYAIARRPRAEPGVMVDAECVGDALDALVVWD